MKLLILLLLPITLFSQIELDRNFFRLSEDVYHIFRENNGVKIGKYYKTIKVGIPDEERIWMVDDISYIGELPNLIDKRTQVGMNGIGHMINGVNDSSLFNYQGALKVCPIGWRIPRIGEFDTLVSYLSLDMKFYLFNNSNGIKYYNNTVIGDSTIVKNEVKSKGSFYWTSSMKNGKHIGIEIDDTYKNFSIGYADDFDFLSVKCIKSEE